VCHLSKRGRSRGFGACHRQSTGTPGLDARQSVKSGRSRICDSALTSAAHCLRTGPGRRPFISAVMARMTLRLL
jgi:hypothetical protein